MYKYVKIKGYKEWFLFIDNKNYIDNDYQEILNQRRYLTLIDAHNRRQPSFFERFAVMLANRVIYNELYMKHQKPVLASIKGTHMIMDKNMIIVDEVKYIDFPIEKFYDIVICENDRYCEYSWYEFLTKNIIQKILVQLIIFQQDPKNILKSILIMLK